MAAITSLAAFALWTGLVQCVDVRPVGQNGTSVGFATLNVWLHGLSGVHMGIYAATDWLGLVPIAACLCFGVMGAVQLARRGSLLRVDADLLLLGAYHIVVILCYLAFETVPVNCRPIPIDGTMEASYPSSTALLVLGAMPTLKFQADRRAHGPAARGAATAFAVAFSALVVLGRLVAGVHWATDVVGAVLLAAGLFAPYASAVACADQGKAADQRKAEPRAEGRGRNSARSSRS